MNPTVNKRKLEREEVKEKKKKTKGDEVEEILEEVRKEFQFLKDSSLHQFAEELKQDKLDTQL